MTPLYNAGIALYKTAAKIAALRSPKIATMLRGQEDTFRRLRSERERKAPDGYDLWIHAASLGEFEQARPLIERLRREQPDVRVLLSFFSPSGFEVRKNYEYADTVVYLPFDTPSNVRSFLDAAAPRKAIFVKYEFWGNYMSELARRSIPVYLISAIFRKKQIFFRPWGGEFRGILACYSHIFVQDENSKRLLDGIGIRNVTVAGDTRFDRVCDIMAAGRELHEIAAFCADSQFTLIAGSSWPQDEDIYIQWLKSRPEAKAICAPHEFDSRRLAELLSRFGDGAMLYSDYLKNAPEPSAVRYLIIDCFGLLSSLYRYGDAAWVGGGFGAGIHNLNEAAVYGIPVIFGPRHGKFKEAADLMACGGGFAIARAEDGRRVLDTLYGDAKARTAAGAKAGDYISRSIGATDCILTHLYK
ncbi:MAG: 3-deoxy-D-manno-octulosonic acid transferase [Muribaculaceae bacterium]|nr:3-deoxy-D-manno-octulosonic acid transferase [Muribaculaceae bacterium]